MLLHNAVPHLNLVLVTALNKLKVISSTVMGMRPIFHSVKELVVVYVNTPVMQVLFAVEF